jgi:intracellular septation protein
MHVSDDTKSNPEASPIARLLLDLGPLVVYFLAYWLTAKNIFLATGVFMAATAGAMLWSLARYRRISAIQWFSAVMVLVLGGLTILLHEEWIIKIKPTLYYLTISGILFFGLSSNRPTLQLVLGSAYPGLTERGWTLLTRNWALFFVAMALANEAVWRTTSTSFWLGYKFWGALPATILFGMANIPMLMRHGMTNDTVAKDPPIPHQE